MQDITRASKGETSVSHCQPAESFVVQVATARHKRSFVARLWNCTFICDEGASIQYGLVASRKSYMDDEGKTAPFPIL